MPQRRLQGIEYLLLLLRSPPLWNRLQHVCLSRSRPGFDPRSGQVSWVRFFWGLSSPVRQMSGSFRPPRSPNIIWPSLSWWLIIHYGRQWPEMLTCPKTSNIHTYTFIKEFLAANFCGQILTLLSPCSVPELWYLITCRTSEWIDFTDLHNRQLSPFKRQTHTWLPQTRLADEET